MSYFMAVHNININMTGREDEELIWLENPSGDFKTPWTAHVLTHGPDVYFRFTNMNTSEGMKPCIFTAQFFTESISVYWTTQENGLFTDASKVSKCVLTFSLRQREGERATSYNRI